MAENSNIEWTTHTFNPWRGCTKVAAGCANCYADTLSKRNPGTLGIWGPHGTRVVASESQWRLPLKWNAEAGKVRIVDKDGGRQLNRPRVFCASLADVFEDWDKHIQVNDFTDLRICTDDGQWVRQSGAFTNVRLATLADVRRRLFALIDATPNLDWLLLTKRPENIRAMWPTAYPQHSMDWPRTKRESDHRRNVWIGTSVATQEDADRNIPHLLKCRDLSPVLFLSAEPLLGPVDIWPLIKDSRICESCRKMGRDGLACEHCGKQCFALSPLDWVIAGGESGPHARPMHPDWVRSLRDQCAAAGVPFLFKQWGEWAEASQVNGGVDCMAKIQAIHPNGTLYEKSGIVPRGEGVAVVHRAGKKAAGRTLDGVIHDGYPASAPNQGIDVAAG